MLLPWFWCQASLQRLHGIVYSVVEHTQYQERRNTWFLKAQEFKFSFISTFRTLLCSFIFYWTNVLGIFRCASISWFQVVSQWVSDVFRLAHLRVFQSYFIWNIFHCNVVLLHIPCFCREMKFHRDISKNRNLRTNFSAYYCQYPEGHIQPRFEYNYHNGV